MFAPFRHAALIFFMSLAAPVLADETILTVTGAVAQPAEGEAWTFDMASLRQLPAARIETTTIWTTGTQTFEGVSLVDLLAHVGATGSSIRAVALNDYAVSIPMADAVAGGAVVAYAQNGSEMSIRNKGPLWIIYPFDGNEIYKSEEYYSRSIWQLDRIEVITEK
ncbi:molybdopterin-dependent oxidoreductase [Roseobacter litoralis]|uniref:Oxidoreductase, molybdopterin binding protein n=1 Tax=Roseobacter litoralis (strain ATCC 49566 / DSM 6996 / JCM 21268 / NBRC 15278 / OCh 149) TaxID=391595 RepID=F7ZE92_ROSLO|nr:molybdopterin-dependent oxidoreductase [Roseobacter litoralis]AEI94605.1 putative oxidoreductase, molybdopterin binding protein [Roseobacter litoralis Och 149]